MPRLTPVYTASRVKKFTNYKPEPTFKVLLPPILADKVSNKKERNKGVECLQEMTVMMACWKEKDFAAGRCSKEIESFQKCSAAAAAALAKKRELEKKGVFSNDGGKMPSQYVNKLLARFPQPPHRY
ncbi:small ribosomal subunit protein mS37-like [Liolophura sinensis]|uniref:small ribosomal subunit protein mS37-like n=1 Tax=Liolophura sinensis TaxID=3198878 RepID=UPI003159415A